MLRRKPPGKLLKSAHMVEREYRVLAALEGFRLSRAARAGAVRGRGRHRLRLLSHGHVDGRIFWDPAMPASTREERAGVYDAMNEALARLHAIDFAAAGLSDFGKPGNYFARQLQRWSEQYRASETG